MTDVQFVTKSSIRGYHVYKSIWSPEIGETLSTKKEDNTPHDKFTVAVVKSKLRVGQYPKRNFKDMLVLSSQRGNYTLYSQGQKEKILHWVRRFRSALWTDLFNSKWNKDNETVMSKLRKLLAQLISLWLYIYIYIYISMYVYFCSFNVLLYVTFESDWQMKIFQYSR